MVRSIGHFIGGKTCCRQVRALRDVFDPNTGEVQAKVALASASEVGEAVADAKAAQVAWAARNPQARARVMMKFLELANAHARRTGRPHFQEHGKTIPDALGDLQRGLEVAEFACGIPHLLKGEFTEGAGPGIDTWSVRQPVGVAAGITPFNFPAMIPLWKAAPAIACGNAFLLKPSERDPSCPMRIAELFVEAGLPPGVLNVINGDKEAVDAILDHPDIAAVGFVGSTPIAEYVYGRGTAHGKRVQTFGGAKNHMIIMPDADLDQAVDALIGAGYGSAGERCMAISVAVPVGQATADALIEKLVPRVEKLKVGLSSDREADYGPLVTRQHLEKVKGYVELGLKEGAKLKVDGRNFRMQGYESGYFLGGCLFDEVQARHAHLQGGDLRPGAVGGQGQELRGGGRAAQQARIRQRRRHLHPRRRCGARFRLQGPGRHGRHQRADPGAGRLPHVRRLEALGVRRPQPARPGFDPVLHQDQDHNLAVAVRHQGRRPVRPADHAATPLRGAGSLPVIQSGAYWARRKRELAVDIGGAISDVLGSFRQAIPVAIVFLVAFVMRWPVTARRSIHLAVPVERAFGSVDFQSPEQVWHRPPTRLFLHDAAQRIFKAIYAAGPSAGMRARGLLEGRRARNPAPRLVIDRHGIAANRSNNELMRIVINTTAEHDGARLAMEYHWGPRPLLAQLLARLDLGHDAAAHQGADGRGRCGRRDGRRRIGRRSARHRGVVASAFSSCCSTGWSRRWCSSSSIVHELGHLVAFRVLGQPWGRIVFIPFVGAIAVPRQAFRTLGHYAFASLAGPGLSLVLLMPALLARRARGRAGRDARCDWRWSPAWSTCSISCPSCRSTADTWSRPCASRSVPAR